MSLEVLRVDNHLLSVRKPSGLPCVPDESGDESLLDIARAWVEEEFDKPGRAFLGVVHRLDRPVSGVVLFARTSKAAQRLTDAFRDRRVEKTYLGVHGAAPPRKEGVVDQWLRKDHARNRVTAFESEIADAKHAVTLWRELARAGGRALLEWRPETGRSHQIRVAAATLGIPLLGDLRYGASAALQDRSIALHARALVLEHPVRREPLRIEAALPTTPEWSFGEWAP